MSIEYQEIGNELRLGTLKNIEVIHTLWSGYGTLVRIQFSQQTVIIKHIQLPKSVHHPRGWNTNLSHQRKLHSYEVEVNWYEHFSNTIDKHCRIPQALKCFHEKNEWLIVMEDLHNAGFTVTLTKPKQSHLEASLHWLANFHARYMGKHSELIWRYGTYWHLETRPDELEVLKDEKLKSFAKELDKTLNDTLYQTIVHGDAKLANFCFTEDGNSAAAVDFQYVGHGCGMKDIAYFMSSAIEPHKCFEMEIWVLDTYFKALKEGLNFYHPRIDASRVEEEWRALFGVAWSDFQRFLKGWSPTHYKVNAYTEALTTKTLQSLKSSQKT